MMPRSVLLLAGAQALYWCGQMTALTYVALVGGMLADNPALATVPQGCVIVGNILVNYRLSALMHRRGRRAGFQVASLAGGIGALTAAVAIWLASFGLFIVACLMIGVAQAGSQYYRLAATDGIDPAQRGRAVALVLAGSVVAALVAPTIAIWSRDQLAPYLYAGSYLTVAAFMASPLLLVFPFLRLPAPSASAAAAAGGRSLGQIARKPLFQAAIVNAAIGQGIMVMVMTATPLAVVQCLAADPNPSAKAAWVIQWHVLGMFVPSFFTGRLVDRFGAARIALLGLVVLAASIAVATSALELPNFLISSCLLGIGWNFMYISGTTQIAAAHRPEERGRVQGFAEMSIACIGAVSSFAAGGLLSAFGWVAVNLCVLPLMLLALALNLRLIRHDRRPAIA